jgi:glycosyltransferase involved in cell wall biosynthesis
MFSAPPTGAIEVPRICVVIPSYNCAQWLERAVKSAFSFCSSPKSVVVVDDGSTDHTSAVCAQLLDRFASLKVLVKPNGGLSSARNHGIEYALKERVGDYLVLLDADDMLLPADLSFLSAGRHDMVRIGVEEIVEGRDGAICHCESNSALTGKEYLRRSFDSRSFYTPSCAYLYRLEWLRDSKVRFMDGLIHEDNLFTVQALLRAASVKAVPDLVYRYIRRPDSITTSIDEARFRRRIRSLAVITRELTMLANQHPDLDARWWIDETVHNAAALAQRCTGAGALAETLGMQLRYMVTYRGWQRPGVRYMQRTRFKELLVAWLRSLHLLPS